jgi:MFS transporter, AAHS family, 4-hydroxybenzoate transporter
MTTHTTMAKNGAPSLSSALEAGPWSGLRARAVAFAILAVVIDGFDIQLLGVAIPALMRDWNVPREAFVPVVAASLIAMSAGTALGGVLGDRLGRRWSLIGSLVLFGGATLAAAAAESVPQFMLARVVAGVGLGGAMPNSVALLSEFTPGRWRSTMVTLGMICTPVGGVLAGLVAALLLEDHGWQVLFVFGGVAPLAVALVLIMVLPESPHFLAAHPMRRAALDRLAAKLGVAVGEITREDPRAPRIERRDFFAPRLRRQTLLVWIQFFGVLTAAYTVFNWFPTLVVNTGLATTLGAAGLAAFNLGGIAGALGGAVLIARNGSRGLTLVFGSCGVLSACVAAYTLLGGGSTAIVASLFVAGFFIAGLQPLLFAIAANVYPTAIRATGVGTALAVGRIGAIASAALGSVLIGYGATWFFAFIGVLMIVVTISLAALSDHAPAHPKN